jgi:transcriptional antiterminator NusG
LPAEEDNSVIEEESMDEEEVVDENISSEPLEYFPDAEEGDLDFKWYILKVAVNREDSIKAALLRRIKMNGLERYFADIVVPTEDVKEYTKAGKARVVKHKMYLGYLLVKMVINDETWFVVRETPGIGDFTGSGGKPTPMDQKDVDRILKISRPVEEAVGQIKTNIPFKHGDRVRVKDGNFQNFEGDVDKIDEANGRVTVLVNIFGRSTPVELEHWQIESV